MVNTLENVFNAAEQPDIAGEVRIRASSLVQWPRGRGGMYQCLHLQCASRTHTVTMKVHGLLFTESLCRGGLTVCSALRSKRKSQVHYVLLWICCSMAFQVPEHLCCNITMDMFRDPVVTPSGVTYERSVILEHLERVHTVP